MMEARRKRRELPPELVPWVLVADTLDVFDVYAIGDSFENLADALRERPAPYPWCYGSPTKAACIEAGFCRRSPSCGD